MEKTSETSSIKVSESSLKAFSEQHNLKVVKLCQNDKDYQLNQKKREVRKRKTAEPTRKDFELLSRPKQGVKVNS